MEVRLDVVRVNVDIRKKELGDSRLPKREFLSQSVDEWNSLVVFRKTRIAVCALKQCLHNAATDWPRKPASTSELADTELTGTPSSFATVLTM